MRIIEINFNFLSKNKQTMKKNLFLSGLFLCAMTLGVMSCGDDDKEDEIVPDPLETEKEYYIAGTVSDANGALSGATVALNDQSVTTDGQGVYNFTVTETGNYTVKFSASGKENLEQQVSIAAGAANRTQVTLNVKLAKAIDMSAGKTEEVKKDEETTVEVVATEKEEAPAASVVNIPAGAAEEGTKVTAVTYQEPEVVVVKEETSTAVKTEERAMSNVAVETNPADAKAQEDVELAIENYAEASEETAFDPEFMTVYKEESANTRASVFNEVVYKNNSYVVVIPKGQTIAGKYSTKVSFNSQAAKAKNEGANKVNGQSETVRIENRDYNATEVTLDLELTSGWEYVISPEDALKAVGASTKLAPAMNVYIKGLMGGSNPGLYTTKKQLKAAISGNHVLFFGSKPKTQDKTFSFSILVKGKKVTISIKTKSYIGSDETYTNAPISQHSGGTGN